MSYDGDLAERVRAQLACTRVDEKRMFGSLAFLVGGHMAVAASGQGGLMVRVAPDQTEALLSEQGAEPFEMRGRPMTGWLRVQADAVQDDDALAQWVRRGVECAGSLPPK
jgi:TfoX/Sxy family transcriptional regulator of competence genes